MFNAQLTGRLHVTVDGKSCDVRGKRARSILGYLLLNQGQAISRDALAGQLWPNQSNEQARTNLRREIFSLRKSNSLWESSIQSDKHSITLDLIGQTDVHRFYGLQKRFLACNSTDERTQLGCAAFDELRGDLLADVIDDWVTQPRLELRTATTELAELLLEDLQQTNQFDTAIRIAEKLIQSNPYAEHSYLSLMGLHLHAGDRGAALHVYRRCESTLIKELGILPNGDLLRLYQSLMNDQSVPSLSIGQVINSPAAMVGRTGVLGRISDVITANTGSAPQFILVSGEAGIGKTRVLQEVERLNRDKSAEIVNIRCQVGIGSTAHSGLVDLFGKLSCRTKIDSLPNHFRSELTQSLPQVFATTDDTEANETKLTNRSRGRVFEGLTRLLSQSAFPVVVLVDDMHWIDSDTADWFSFLMKKHLNRPVTVVATIRPEDLRQQPRLQKTLDGLSSGDTYYREILEPLSSTEIQEILEPLSVELFPNGLSLDVWERVYRTTAGNPFYAIECVRVLGQDYGKVNDQFTQSKLSWFISRRLDTVSDAGRRLLDGAAVIGRPFTPSTLQHLFHLDNECFMTSMEELWQRGFFATRDAGRYGFSHDIVREYLYAELSPPRKQYLHGAVAETLERQFKNSNVGNRAEIGRHLESSGNYVSAVSWYREAAEISDSNMAHREAIALCDRGLAILSKVDDDKHLLSTEVAFLMLKARLISLVEGFTAPDVATIFQRICAIEHRITDPEQRHLVAKQFRFFLSFGNRPRRALRLASDQIEFARVTGDPMKMVESWRCRGVTEYQLGRFRDSEASMNKALSIFEVERRASRITVENAPFFVPAAFRFRAMAQLIQNRPEDSAQSIRDSELYRTNYEEAFAIIVMLMTQANIMQLLHDVTGVRTIAEELSAFSDHHYLPKMKCFSDFLFGWVIAEEGDAEQALELFKATQSRYPINADHHMFPTWWAHRGNVELRLGHVAEGLNSIKEGIAASRRTRQATWLAELHRLLGIALHQHGASKHHVDAALELSSRIATRQHATLFENRTEETRLAILLS